ncbi:hypothetical protein [Streptomyces yangpuensis]|uniref:hypothetical protein n=1 Tax=Streptomyces yangpuensis TaxID=1648182 RepID=UPI003718F4D5
MRRAYFTAEDLAGLEPGEVWAGDRAMTRKEFREHRRAVLTRAGGGYSAGSTPACRRP